VRISLVIAFVALVGCHGTRKTIVPDIPQNGNATARSRFTEARAAFLHDGSGEEAFKQIVQEFPNDPIVPWAELYEGMASLKAKKLAQADQVLAHVIETAPDQGLSVRAQLFLGITKNYEGDAAGALNLLKNAGKAVENDDERTEFLAATAYASASAAPLQSLRVFDLLWPRVNATEKAMILARVEDVVASADPQQLRRVLDELEDRKAPGTAVVASRLVAIAEETGNANEAQRLREMAGPARQAVGLPRTIAPATGPVASGGDAGLVGAVIPLVGKSSQIGEKAVTGLGLIAGVGDGKGVAAVEVRTAADATAAAEAVDSLARGNAIAVVGPVDGASVDAAGGRAESLGVVLLSLATRPEERTTGKYVFHIVHSAEARARALAKRAMDKGKTRFAVLAPDNGYGKSVTAAFVDAVSKAGGVIVTKVTYPKDTKSFASFAGKLGGDWDTLFVPETAETLALIAPALDAAGKKPMPIGTKKVTGGRPILLLSTAEALSSQYVIDAGRHSEGAFLAPGFYPDDQDPSAKPFIDRFAATYGRRPGAIEAYAYDAAQLAASAGTGGRAALAQLLAKSQLAGLTGTIQFDADHRRSDPGVIYTVVEDKGTFSIRVAR
jgi:ABC-type branched-subunit amino acid transport system substrate-binding protein